MCKTPVVEHHDEMCRYRLTREALDEITRLHNGLQEVLGNGDSAEKSWCEAIDSLIGRFNVAGSFGGKAVHGGDDAKAVATLLTEMANRLDGAIDKTRKLLDP